MLLQCHVQVLFEFDSELPIQDIGSSIAILNITWNQAWRQLSKLEIKPIFQHLQRISPHAEILSHQSMTELHSLETDNDEEKPSSVDFIVVSVELF